MRLGASRISPFTRPRRDPALGTAIVALGVLGAFGGARPTGVGWLDAVLLGLGGAAATACGARSRTIPLYVAAAAAAVLQPAVVPLALGVVGLLCAFARGFGRRWPLGAALAGGLAWAAAVGAPGEPAARPVYVPLVVLAWVLLSARKHGGQRFRRNVDRVVVGLAGLALGATQLTALGIASARSDVDRGVDLLESGLAAARDGDSEAALADLGEARLALRRGERSLGALWARAGWAVPVVSQNARSLHGVVADVADLAAVGHRAVDQADLDRLRARAGQVDLAAVAATEEPLTAVLAQLDATSRTVERFSRQLLLPPVQSRLDDLRRELDDAIPSAELALDGVRLAPGMLGGDGPRTYLVLFTTPVEARARTGFPGNFAEVTFTDGRFDKTRFGRISDLIAALPPGGGTITGPADYLTRYARFGPAEDWRNITMSPDFPSVAAVAAELYPQSGGGQVDGVMSVDPVALAALLRFTGPISVPGVDVPLGPDNAAQFLLRDQYVDITDNPERIDVLERLADLAFDRLSSADLPGPRELGDILGPVVEQGNLQVVTFGEDEVPFLDRLGISGRFPDVAGDFLSVTTTNAAGNKIDLFMQRTLDYDVTWDPATGRIAATATITLTNQAPPSGLPDYLIGNLLGAAPEVALPKGWNKTFITLYTPWDHTEVTLDGEPVGLERFDELGRRALSTFVAIGPGATRTLVVRLEGVLPGPTYRLDLAAQPLVTPEGASVRVVVRGAEGLRATGPVRAAGAGARGDFLLIRPTRITVSDG